MPCWAGGSNEEDERIYDENRCDFMPIKAPVVTAHSWLVCDSDTGKPLMWFKPKEVLQPASITKVVTAMVVLEKCNRMNEAEKKRYLRQPCRVSGYAASFASFNEEYGWNSGTNARLKEGEVYTLRELLYAMMLPSGNDASICIAETFGAQFQPDPSQPECSSYDKEGPIARFVAQMNRHVRKVGLVCYSPASTYFMSPHGMGNDLNVSCALDIARFSREAMRNRIFKKIVKSTKYTAEANKKNRRDTSRCWLNTNTLLRAGLTDVYDGVKTGWIPNAHNCKEWGCLVTRVRSKYAQPSPGPAGDDCRTVAAKSLFVVVLGCKSQEKRFTDTGAIVQWAWRVLEQQSMASGRAQVGALPVAKVPVPKAVLLKWVRGGSKPGAMAGGGGISGSGSGSGSGSAGKRLVLAGLGRGHQAMSDAVERGEGGDVGVGAGCAKNRSGLRQDEKEMSKVNVGELGRPVAVEAPWASSLSFVRDADKLGGRCGWQGAVGGLRSVLLSRGKGFDLPNEALTAHAGGA